MRKFFVKPGPAPCGRRGGDPIRRHPIRGVRRGLACAFFSVVAACTASDQSVEALRSQAAGVFPRLNANAAAADADCAGSWAVLLQLFPAGRGQDQAPAALESARRAGLASARLEQRSLGLALLVGAFPSAEDAGARRTLERIRAIQVEGRQPYANAILLPPPPSGSAGGAPQWSLATLRKQRGDSETLYTLQVAVYQSDSAGAACQAAEQAARALRDDGEEAFYHHGSGRSIVTIGVFSPRDYDPLTGAMSAPLAQLRRRHPYNLVNGRTMRERMPSGEWVEQPSALVVVP